MARKRTRTKRSRNTRRVPRTRRKTRRRVIRKTRTHRGGKSKRRRRNRLRSKLQRGGGPCRVGGVVQAWGDPIKITRHPENGYEHIVEINPNPNFWRNEIENWPNDGKIAEVQKITPGHQHMCNVSVQTNNNEHIVIKVKKENIKPFYGGIEEIN